MTDPISPSAILTRRRLIAISAAFVGGGAVAAKAGLSTGSRTGKAAGPARLWTGQALGARASIRLVHPDADAVARRVAAEIDRLEDILSLYRPDSALCRLNRTGSLDAPPFELLDCLSLAGLVHRESGGRFDASIQPLWALWAQNAAAGRGPGRQALAETLARTGWSRVAYDAGRATLASGMALTLNGIGQGYVADRVAALLEAERLTDILVDTGELRALGGLPGAAIDPATGWPVRLESGGRVSLRQRALATSAPLGTTFDEAGQHGHILDPATGMPAALRWRSVSVSAPSAAIADALATAACLMPDRPAIEAMIGRFDGARLEALA